MFTGLIREIGVLRRMSGGRGLSRLEIHAPRTAPEMGLGDSLAVNGICLTVTAVRGGVVTVEAAAETRRIATLRTWRTGRKLHLEPALRAGQALDGHLVLGHVDGVGRIEKIRRQGPSLFITVHCGRELAGWLMPKGSVAVDGVSLTVDAGPHTDSFTVHVIPHTLGWTDFASFRTGREVNLEMDVLVKAARTGRTAEVLSVLKADASGSGGPTRPEGSVPSLASILDRGFGRKGTS